MKKLLSTCLLPFAFFSTAALATTQLTLTDVSGKNTTNPQDMQCLFIANSCPPGHQDMAYYGFDQTLNTVTIVSEPNKNTAGLPSTSGGNYTVGYLTGFFGNTFGVGIDVNTTGARSEYLDYFEVWIGGSLAYAYYGDQATGNPANGNIGDATYNGNGFFDWTLTNISLVGYDADTLVVFKSKWSNAVDGGENFFVYRTSCTVDCEGEFVPEPGSLSLIGLALVGLGLARRGRRG